MRGGAIGINGGERDMTDHERAARTRQHLPERAPVRCLQLRHGRIKVCAEVVGVAVHAADARKMLQRGTDAGFLQPTHIGGRDRAHDDGIGRDRTLPDQRMEIEAIAPGRRLQVEHRREVEVDSEIREFAAMNAAELFGFGLLLVWREPGECCQRRNFRQRR